MIDTHCHINDPVYISNPEKYVLEAKEAGVTKMLVVGYDLNSSRAAVEIANRFPDVYAAIGIHPSEVKKAGHNDLKEIEKLVKDKKVIAIGEIGLDFYWDKDEDVKREQATYFKLQIELANKHKLPIVIHCREASEAALELMQKHKPHHGGIMHCYSGSLEMVKDYAKLGLLFGFGGVVTFKNAIRAKDVIKNIDKNLYVLETDAPYLAPTPHRGELNHSKFLPLIVDEIANLRGTSPEEVILEADNNFKRVFKLWRES